MFVFLVFFFFWYMGSKKCFCFQVCGVCAHMYLHTSLASRSLQGLGLGLHRWRALKLKLHYVAVSAPQLPSSITCYHFPWFSFSSTLTTIWVYLIMRQPFADGPPPLPWSWQGTQAPDCSTGPPESPTGLASERGSMFVYWMSERKLHRVWC